jgi:hypothetical protein
MFQSPTSFNVTLRLEMDLDMRSIKLLQRDASLVLEDRVRELIEAAARDLVNRYLLPLDVPGGRDRLDAVVAKVIKEVVKESVTAEVDQRVDEFFGNED